MQAVLFVVNAIGLLYGREGLSDILKSTKRGIIPPGPAVHRTGFKDGMDLRVCRLDGAFPAIPSAHAPAKYFPETA